MAAKAKSNENIGEGTSGVDGDDRRGEGERSDESIEMATLGNPDSTEVPIVTVINSASGTNVLASTAQRSPHCIFSQSGVTRDRTQNDVFLGDHIVVISASKTSGLSINSLSSDTSNICRICHMSEKETCEPLSRTDCECRGGLESVHRSCLIQWVSYKRNNRCELCGVVFPSVSPPRSSSSTDRQRRRIEAVYQQYTQLRPMTRRKRALLGSLSLFLVITTSATGILTVSTEREFQRIHLDPWTSGQQRMDSYISFSICLSFLLFCATLTVGVLLIWLFLEGSYYRRRERFYNFAQQIARHEGGNRSPENTT